VTDTGFLIAESFLFSTAMSDPGDSSAPAAARAAAVEQALGHRFGDARLLLQACTHASRCGPQASPADKRRDANERLEFLGDALLGGALCLILFRRFPDADEGLLSRLKSRLVSREILARAIEDAGLLTHCRVGNQMGQAWPDSVKANLMESLLAAVFFDGGWPALELAVERLFAGRIADPTSADQDARMRLQTWCLEHHKKLPDYTCERSGGSDHEPQFLATAAIGALKAEGRGGSRRRAEAAAADALMALLAPV
jgi:ribonuclease-3